MNIKIKYKGLYINFREYLEELIQDCLNNLTFNKSLSTEITILQNGEEFSSKYVLIKEINALLVSKQAWFITLFLLDRIESKIKFTDKDECDI